MAWYILQTKPNYEAKVISHIETKIRDEALKINEIFSPEEVVREFKNGQPKEKRKRIYTNYIFLEMEYEDKIWHSLKGIAGVVKIVGNGNNPSPVPLKQIDEMRQRVKDGELQVKVAFQKGDNVRIKEGSFVDFIGEIEKVIPEKNKAIVGVNIFGRQTSVEIEMSELEIV